MKTKADLIKEIDEVKVELGGSYPYAVGLNKMKKVQLNAVLRRLLEEKANSLASEGEEDDEEVEPVSERKDNVNNSSDDGDDVGRLLGEAVDVLAKYSDQPEVEPEVKPEVKQLKKSFKQSQLERVPVPEAKTADPVEPDEPDEPVKPIKPITVIELRKQKTSETAKKHIRGHSERLKALTKLLLETYGRVLDRRELCNREKMELEQYYSIHRASIESDIKKVVDSLSFDLDDEFNDSIDNIVDECDDSIRRLLN